VLLDMARGKSNSKRATEVTHVLIAGAVELLLFTTGVWRRAVEVNVLHRCSVPASYIFNLEKPSRLCNALRVSAGYTSNAAIEIPCRHSNMAASVRLGYNSWTSSTLLRIIFMK
jgi:hypothetical protein